MKETEIEDAIMEGRFYIHNIGAKRLYITNDAMNPPAPGGGQVINYPAQRQLNQDEFGLYIVNLQPGTRFTVTISDQDKSDPQTGQAIATVNGANFNVVWQQATIGLPLWGNVVFDQQQNAFQVQVQTNL